MANLETPLHIEDVIFNKPSLKELIRLIKNGSVNAIWPSTQAEVDDWNATGRFLYKDIIYSNKVTDFKNMEPLMRNKLFSRW